MFHVEWSRVAESAANVLGIPSKMLQDLAFVAPTERDAMALWQRYLPEVRKLWKRRAFELHPDRGGDATAFAELQQAWDAVQRDEYPLLVRRALLPNRQCPTTVVAQVFGGTSTTSTTASTTMGSSGIYGSAFYPAFVNVRRG